MNEYIQVFIYIIEIIISENNTYLISTQRILLDLHRVRKNENIILYWPLFVEDHVQKFDCALVETNEKYFIIFHCLV